jgi:single-strand DNA-binding protein
MINKAILAGNLGRDPEIRTTQSGKKVANLRLATTERWKDRNSGEMKERTEWHTVIIWNEHLITVAEKYLHKGSKIYLEGQITTRKWTDQQNNERYSTEIVVNPFKGELQMLDSKPKEERKQDERPPRTSRNENADEPFDDEIPF